MKVLSFNQPFKYIFWTVGLFFFNTINGQTFTLRDSLQGGLRKERTCFDVQHYRLQVQVNIEEKYLKGSNQITFRVVEPTQKIQLDLFANMQIDSLLWGQQSLPYQRIHDAFFVDFPAKLSEGETHQITCYYQGSPLEAKNAPWDGGFVWKKDSNGKPFVGVAVQGTGASLWYPVKDHQSDEPDFGADILVSVPNDLVNVSNGTLVAVKELPNQYREWHWNVSYPINTYNIVLNIGDYVLIEDAYQDLTLHYYVLRENEDIARKQFEEVHPMMTCFYDKFGPYPFAKDTYKLIETPYLGMEHQSAVAYGNRYRKGYLGRDISGTGIGMAFDYILIHETAHEWFGNSITSKDIADMWIHESFTTYAETVYVECTQGYEAAKKYIFGQSKMVANKNPMIGVFGVNAKPKSSDHYYKGALMLHTLRHTFAKDDDWWKTLKLFTETFAYQIIESKEVVDFFQNHTDWNLIPFFEQYLQHPEIPKLQLRENKNRWEVFFISNVENFQMPIFLEIDGVSKRVLVGKKTIKIKAKTVNFPENVYYVK